MMDRYTTGLRQQNELTRGKQREQLMGSVAWDYGQVAPNGTFSVYGKPHRGVTEAGEIMIWAEALFGSPPKSRKINVMPYGDVEIYERTAYGWDSAGLISYADVRPVHPKETGRALVVPGNYVLKEQDFYQLGTRRFSLDQVIEKLKERKKGYIVDPICDFVVAELSPEYTEVTQVFQIALRNFGRSGFFDAVIFLNGESVPRRMRKPFSYDEQ